MQPQATRRFDQLAFRAAALAALGAAMLYALSSRVQHDSRPVVSAHHANVQEVELSSQVQTILAEGGCPGWIAVANHPEWLEPQQNANAPGRQTTAPSVRLTADRREATVPRVTYPVPLRIAARSATPAAAPQLSTTTDADDLLDGAEDLLAPTAGGNAVTPLPAVDDEPAEAQKLDAATVKPQAIGNADDDELLAPDDDLLDGADDLAPPTPAKKLERVVPKRSLAGKRKLAKEDEDLLTDEDDLLVPPKKESLPAPPATPSPAPPAASPGAAPLAPQTTQPGSPFVPPPRVPNPHAGATSPKTNAKADAKPQTPLERCEFVAKSLYPAATECRTCHEQIYDEWAVSSHAYAMVSPMFHKFEQKINEVAQGTIGYFCYRCHSPAGVSLGISRAAPLWDLPQVAREGVTCVACHRINEFYGRTNGERRIVPGDVYAPVYGSIGGDGVATALAQKEGLKLKASPEEKGPGQPIHTAGVLNPQLAMSDFCITCHQVAVYPGIKLEVVWEQYRASPACKKGIRCQDCHMGRIPGIPSGFECGPAAVVNQKNVNDQRRHSNHVFYGPGYSIAHPGVFPFNPKAYRWSMRDWLQFDWRAGWGTEEFEDAVDDGVIKIDFPEVWKESDDRCDAREIIDDNLKRRGYKDRVRKAVMENGSHVDGPFFKQTPARGQELQFEFIVMNTNEGHNLPTASLGAQPQLWANVVLVGPRGNRLWESGYLDTLGDLADIHSVDVRNKRLAFDSQLFNLQTMFLITGAKGTDREFYLPVNIDVDPLPFIRPGAQPITVINHPPFIRMEARSLAPLGSRRVPYKVPAELLCEPGPYRLSFRMRSRLEPLYFMRFCDSTPEMQRAMTEGILDFHESSVEFFVR